MNKYLRFAFLLFLFYIGNEFIDEVVMVVTFAVVMFGILALVRPLQRNPFYIMHSAAVVLVAYYIENHFFKTTPFVFKTLMLLLVFHIISINLFAFLAMGADKRAAQKGDRRIAERNLHQLEMMGGIPGSWFGQKFFHHKTAKKQYQSTFMLILIVQIGLIIGIFKYLNFW